MRRSSRSAATRASRATSSSRCVRSAHALYHRRPTTLTLSIAIPPAPTRPSRWALTLALPSPLTVHARLRQAAAAARMHWLIWPSRMVREPSHVDGTTPTRNRTAVLGLVYCDVSPQTSAESL